MNHNTSINALRLIVAMFLIFNALTALSGGWLLISDPSGGAMKMETAWLQHSPFADYFVPGLVLFIANGVLSVVVLLFTAFKAPWYGLWIVGQGVVLIGWLIAQMAMLRLFHPYLHAPYLVLGLLIASLGGVLWALEKAKQKEVFVATKK